jgi:hypothetical protein
MSDDLRTRIAATIYHTAAAWDQDWPWESLVDHVKVIYLEQADAVIEKLGLRQETVYAWSNHRSWPTGTRWVTDWTTDR